MLSDFENPRVNPGALRWAAQTAANCVLLALLTGGPVSGEPTADLLPSTQFNHPVWQTLSTAGTEGLHSVWFVDADHGWVVGERGSIKATTDGGLSWQAQPDPSNENLSDVAFEDDRVGFAVGNQGTVLVTQDAGAHWDVCPFLSKEPLVRVVLDGKRIDIVGQSGTFFASENQGASFTSVPVGDKVPFNGATLLGPGRPLIVGGRSVVYESRFGNYVALASHLTQKRQPSAVFVSVDSGQSWRAGSAPTLDPLYAVSALDANRAVAVGGDVRLSRDWFNGKSSSYGRPVVLVTQDGGLNWTPGSVDGKFTGNLLDVWAWPDGTVWAVGFESQPGLPLLPIPTDGPVLPLYLYSTNGGQTFQRIEESGARTAEHLYFLGHGHGWAVGPKGAVLRYNPMWKVEQLYNQHQYAQAAEELAKVGPDPELQALIEARLNHPDVALGLLRETGTAPGLYLRAVLEYAAQQTDLAVQDLRQANALDPALADAFFLRGLIVAASDQPDLARPYFERYLLLSPDGPHASEAQSHLPKR